MPEGKSRLDRWRKRFDPLRARMDLFISGRAPSDPLYLTNRTWKQKLKIALLIAAPVLLLTVLVTIGATNPFRLHQEEADESPPAETAPPAAPRKALPDPISASTELEVVNIRIARDVHPPVVTGMVRNKTGRKVVTAEVSYYLADTAGSLVGTGKTEVANVAPHGSVAFRMPLKIATAEYVFARDVHPN